MFHRALNKYGVDGFTWGILETGINTLKEANKREKHYVEQYDTYRNGYNMTEGGGGRDNYDFSEESRNRMRKAKLGTTLSESHRKNIGAALRDMPKTKEHNRKVGLANTGKKRSAEVRRLQSIRQIGRLAKDKSPSAIIVNIYNANGELIFRCHGDFDTICKDNGLPARALRKSYYSDGKPIYTSKLVKKEVLNKYKEFIEWYAVKQPQHP